MKYKATPAEKMEMDENELDKYVEIMDKVNKDENPRHLADLMSILTDPSNKHSELITSIGIIIRDNELKEDQKVDAIVNFLI
uniref:Uncharacterized protein n=1 Tax=Pithovirus LCPAC101 TaxID=2506586 RepID=A0A481Z344_9VIRU|nr:MAG: hypothetical protein LCPAC101_02080 [Pithovirus LCPAC101]